VNLQVVTTDTSEVELDEPVECPVDLGVPTGSGSDPEQRPELDRIDTNTGRVTVKQASETSDSQHRRRPEDRQPVGLDVTVPCVVAERVDHRVTPRTDLEVDLLRLAWEDAEA